MALQLPDCASVADAKACLQHQHGVDISALQLLNGSDVLADAALLHELGVRDGSTLTMIALVAKPPLLIGRRKLSDNRQGDDWRVVVISEPLASSVAKIEIHAQRFVDQAWGNCKANIGLGLYDANGARIAFCNVFGTYRTRDYRYGKSPSRTLEFEDVVTKAHAGCCYRVLYTVGGGGGHSIHVKQLTCTIFPTGWTSDEPHQSAKDGTPLQAALSAPAAPERSQCCVIT